MNGKFVITYKPSQPHIAGLTKMTAPIITQLLNLQAIEAELNNDALFATVLESFDLTLAEYQLQTTGQLAPAQQSVEL